MLSKAAKASLEQVCRRVAWRPLSPCLHASQRASQVASSLSCLCCLSACLPSRGGEICWMDSRASSGCREGGRMHPSNVERQSCFSVTTERLVGPEHTTATGSWRRQSTRETRETDRVAVSECVLPALAPPRPTIDAARQDALIHHHKSQTMAPQVQGTGAIHSVCDRI